MVTILLVLITTLNVAAQERANIAYIRNGAEIRVIDSNGNNDRLLWTHPDAKEPLGLFDLAWRPDGKELAFSSAHEAVYSFYHADIYSIKPDGSGFRKITNAPDRKQFDQFKKRQCYCYRTEYAIQFPANAGKPGNIYDQYYWCG